MYGAQTLPPAASQYGTPTIAPVMQVARVPATMARRPRLTRSARRSGAMGPRPPIMIPGLAGLENPHMAQVMNPARMQRPANVSIIRKDTQP